MEFIMDYWAVLLIALILILLVLLAYLIDKETKKLGKEKTISFKLKEKEELKDITSSPKESDYSDYSNYNNHDDLAYDELDIENIDDEFNKVIHKKKIIDEDLKDSIEEMKLEPIKFDNVDYDLKIKLPDIRIKKEKQENIWSNR